MPEQTSYLMPDFCARLFPFHFTTAINTLVQMGLDSSRIDLLAVGRYENFKGEIREQEPRAGEPINPRTHVTLKVGFSSAVDFMPYQFLYSGENWEERAREFMAPFDAAVIRQTAQSRLLALRYNLGLIDLNHLTKVLQLFQFSLEDTSTKFSEALLWTSIFPHFHFWSGNPEWLVRILEYFFPWQFSLHENVRSEYQIPTPLRYQLGSRARRLGREMIIGRSFSECDSSYELVLRGVKTEQIVDLFPGAPMRTRIDWVVKTCMPGFLEYRLRIDAPAGRMKLGRSVRQAYLGYAASI